MILYSIEIAVNNTQKQLSLGNRNLQSTGGVFSHELKRVQHCGLSHWRGMQSTIDTNIDCFVMDCLVYPSSIYVKNNNKRRSTLHPCIWTTILTIGVPQLRGC